MRKMKLVCLVISLGFLSSAAAQSPKESSKEHCVIGYETLGLFLKALNHNQKMLDANLVFIVEELGGEERNAFWRFNEAKKRAVEAVDALIMETEDLEYALRTCARNR